MPSRSRGVGAEHDRRVARGGGVEEAPAGERRAERVASSVGSAAVDADAAGLVRRRCRSLRRTVPPSTRRRRRRRSTPADAADHRRPPTPAASASSPKNDWPGATVSRFVPSRSSWASRSAWLDARDAEHGDHRGDADRDAERRQRGAQPPRAQADRADARGRRASSSRLGPASAVGRSCRTRRVATIAPSRISTRRGSDAAMLAVVGDHDDRRALGVQLAQQREDLGAGARVEVAGRLVGEHDRRPRRRAPGRSPPAGARRPTARPAGGRAGGRGRRARAPRAPAARRSRARHARVEQPVGDVVERGHARRAGRTAGRRSRSGARAAPTARGRRAARRRGRRSRTLAARRPVERAHDVQQRRLARARRPDDATSSPLLDVEVDAAQRLHAAGVRLATPRSSSSGMRQSGVDDAHALAQAVARRPRRSRRRNRPGSTGTRRRCVPSRPRRRSRRRRGQQRRHRHREHVRRARCARSRRRPAPGRAARAAWRASRRDRDLDRRRSGRCRRPSRPSRRPCRRWDRALGVLAVRQLDGHRRSPLRPAPAGRLESTVTIRRVDVVVIATTRRPSRRRRRRAAAGGARAGRDLHLADAARAGRKTTRPSSIVARRASALRFCQRSTAAVVAGVHSPSTVMCRSGS